jgi:hypothetical protein
MNRPITGAIAAALALCASGAVAHAKGRAIAPPMPPKTSEIVLTPQGFVIRERSANAPALTAASTTPVGAAVRFDSALLGTANGENADGAR